MKKILKNVIGIMLVAIIISSTNITLAVSQSDINKQEKQQQENNNKKKEFEQKQDEVQEIKDETLKEVEQLNSQITDYQSQITSLNSQIDEANSKIEDAETKLKQKQEEYDKKQETFKQRLIVIYESGETSYLDVLLNSSSLTDFISNYYLVSELTEMDTQLIKEIENQKQEIEKYKKEIEDSKTSLTQAKASKESVTNELKNTKSEKDAKVSKLSEEEQQIQKQIAEIQKDNVAIDKEIQSMKAQIEAARKAAEEEAKRNQNNSNKNNNSNSGSNSSTTSGTSSAGFIKPVNSSITTGLYYSSGSYHGAVDFGASGVSGMPVYAVADGIVVTAKALQTSYGNYIILYHPKSNLYTLYAHGQAGSIAVSKGQTVKQGQQIMRVGSTGNSTGPHLHFEVRVSPGEYSNRVNPKAYLP